MHNTLSPLAPPYDPETDALLTKYPQQDGYLLSLFRVFANSRRFLAKGVPNLLDRDSPLPLRTRELVILRVTANRGCEYEWGVHVAIFARAAKLTPQDIAATCATPLPDHWTGPDRLLLQMVDQLCIKGQLDPATLDATRQCWTTEQQLEICALIGAYTTVSLTANIAELPLEPFAARFPAAKD